MLFRRLSVFAGGWNLDAIAERGRDVDEAGDPLDGISALVDQSLVVLEPHRPDPRYDMLDIVREYAAARLSDAGETEEIERRHALHYLALAEAAEPHLVRSGHQDWFGRLDVDRGNLRRGMAWTIDHGETVLALRYTVALWRYWRQLGEFAEGRRWSNAALAVAGNAAPSLRAKALCGAAALAFPQADHARMAELAAEAIGLAHQSDDPMDLRNALTIHGMVAMCQGRYTDALEPYTECVAICRGLGISWQLATSHLNLGAALLHSGRAEEAIARFQRGTALYRELGDDIFAARALNHIAHAALAENDLARRRPPRARRASVRRGAGRAARDRRRAGDAGRRGRRALGAGSGRPPSPAPPRRSGRPSLLSAAPFDVAITGPVLQRIKAGVSEERWHRSWDRGQALDPAAAVAYALANRAE